MITTVKEVRNKASEYANKEWGNDFTGNLIEYAKKDFIKGAEWFRSQIAQNNELVIPPVSNSVCIKCGNVCNKPNSHICAECSEQVE